LTDARAQIVPGTLEMLVLKTLSLEPMHGWGIGERIQQLSRDIFTVNQGTLYPTLERLLRAGMITHEWRTTENNRRARYYHITRLGLKHLEAERQEWERSTRAVNLIMRTT
jgi:PadR family transcriptional regulator